MSPPTIPPEAVPLISSVFPRYYKQQFTLQYQRIHKYIILMSKPRELASGKQVLLKIDITNCGGGCDNSASSHESAVSVNTLV